MLLNSVIDLTRPGPVCHICNKKGSSSRPVSAYVMRIETFCAGPSHSGVFEVNFWPKLFFMRCTFKIIPVGLLLVSTLN